MAQKPTPTSTYDKNAGDSNKSNQPRDEQKPPMGGQGSSGKQSGAESKDRDAQGTQMGKGDRENESNTGRGDRMSDTSGGRAEGRGTEGSMDQADPTSPDAENASGTRSDKMRDEDDAGDAGTGRPDEDSNRSGGSSTSGGM